MNVTAAVHSKPTNFRTYDYANFSSAWCEELTLGSLPNHTCIRHTCVYAGFFFFNLDFTILNVLDNVSKSRSSSSFSHQKFSSLALGQIYSWKYFSSSLKKTKVMGSLNYNGVQPSRRLKKLIFAKTGMNVIPPNPTLES